MDQQHNTDTEEAFWRLLAKDNMKFLMFMCLRPQQNHWLQTQSTEREKRKRWEDLAVIYMFNLDVVII